MSMHRKDKNAEARRHKAYMADRMRIAAHGGVEYKPRPKQNKDMFNQGVEFFNSGLDFEMASETQKKDIGFVNGFKHAERLALVREMFYNNGVEWFNKGISLEDTPDKLRNNEFFVQGYKDAMKNRKKSKG